MLPDKHCLSHDICLYRVIMTLHFLNDAANDTKSTQNLISMSLSRLKIETMGKLLKRIPGWRLESKFTRLGFENAC